MAVPRSHGFHERFHSAARHPERAGERNDLVLAQPVARGDVERLAHREQADRHHDDIDAVEQLRKAEGEARLAGLQVDADQAEPDAEEQRRQSSDRGRAEHRRHRHEREHHQREIIGRPEFERPLHHDGREERDAEGADRPGDERADGGGRERRAGAAVAGHLVALERRDDGGAFARGVEQDRGGRAAIHRAVIDAGEQDEGRGRLDLEGDRQEQRDGERRAQPGEDADRGSERGADETPHQIDRSERDRKAVEELREGFHVSRPRDLSPVRSRSRPARIRY